MKHADRLTEGLNLPYMCWLCAKNKEHTTQQIHHHLQNTSM